MTTLPSFWSRLRFWKTKEEKQRLLAESESAKYKQLEDANEDLYFPAGTPCVGSRVRVVYYREDESIGVMEGFVRHRWMGHGVGVVQIHVPYYGNSHLELTLDLESREWRGVLADGFRFDKGRVLVIPLD